MHFSSILKLKNFMLYTAVVRCEDDAAFSVAEGEGGDLGIVEDTTLKDNNIHDNCSIFLM